MNDDELDLWLSVHNEQLDERINAKIDLESRRQQVRSATVPEPDDDEPDLIDVHAIWSEHVDPTGSRPRRGRVRRVITRPVPVRPKKRSSTRMSPSVPVARYRRKTADATRSLAVILVVLFLLVSSAVLGEFANQRGTSSSPYGRGKSVVIGVPTDMSDFGMTQEAHRYGFAYDLANWLADDLHYSATTFYGFPALDGIGADHREMLRSGQVDMFITPTSMADQRGTEVSFVGPYMITQGGVLVRADSTAILTVEDLDGKRVCTWRESTYKEQSRRLGSSTLVEKDDLSSCVEALVVGGVDAVAGDQILLAEAARLQETSELTVVPGLSFGGEQRGREAWVHTGRAQRQAARRDLRDLLAVRVERVERLRRDGRRLQEGARVRHPPPRQALEQEQVHAVEQEPSACAKTATRRPSTVA